MAGKPNVIVHFDQDLLDLSPFEGIPLVGPAAFLARLCESIADNAHSRPNSFSTARSAS